MGDEEGEEKRGKEAELEAITLDVRSGYAYTIRVARIHRVKENKTNLQLYLAIGLPVIAVLASLTVSLVQISAIREEMRGNMQAIREDIREVRGDIKLLTGKVYEMMAQRP